MTRQYRSGRSRMAECLDEAVEARDLQAIAALERDFVSDVATRTVHGAFGVADELASLQSSFEGSEARVYLRGHDRTLQIQVVSDGGRVGDHRLLAVGELGSGALPLVRTLFRGSLDERTGEVRLLEVDEMSLDDIDAVCATLGLVDLPIGRDPALHARVYAMLGKVPTPMWRVTHDTILEAAARVVFREVARGLEAVETVGGPMSIRLDGAEASMGMDGCSAFIAFPDRSGRSDEWRFEAEGEVGDGRGIRLTVGDHDLVYDMDVDEIVGIGFFRQSVGALKVQRFQDIYRDIGAVRGAIERRRGPSSGP